MRIPQEFRFYTSPGIEVEWKDRVADRQTDLGDAAVQGGLSSAFGVPVKGIANLQPYTYKVVSSQYLWPEHQTQKKDHLEQLHPLSPFDDPLHDLSIQPQYQAMYKNGTPAEFANI